MRRCAIALLALVVTVAIAAPVFAPNDPGEEFRDFVHAPPMRVHVRDDAGGWRGPFVYPLRLVSRLEQRYEEDRTKPVSLRWFTSAGLVDIADRSAGPLLLLGADTFGRDILSRLLFGARMSLLVALIGAAGAVLIGVAIGGTAGYVGGAIDEVLMRFSEFVLVLPGLYVVLGLRMLLPFVLSVEQIFILISGILAFAGWPFVARGVRAIVQSEKERDYCAAAVSMGAGNARVLVRHILPSAAGFVAVQATILLPSFILAEATLSYIGLGFPAPIASWGAMLHDEAGTATLTEFPWTLAPGAAIFVVVLACNLIVEASGANPIGATRRVRAAD